MTGHFQGRKAASARRATGEAVKTRQQWRGLVAEALACTRDAEDRARGPDAELRLMTLARRTHGASTDVFAREAGASTVAMAKAFAQLAGAFAGRGTSPELRLQMAAALKATAELMDSRLHDLAQQEFQRAHWGRPEVMG